MLVKWATNAEEHSHQIKIIFKLYPELAFKHDKLCQPIYFASYAVEQYSVLCQ